MQKKGVKKREFNMIFWVVLLIIAIGLIIGGLFYYYSKSSVPIDESEGVPNETEKTVVEMNETEPVNETANQTTKPPAKTPIGGGGGGGGGTTTITPACTPYTCESDYLGQCGEFSDNCGGTIVCGCEDGFECLEGSCVELINCTVDSNCTYLNGTCGLGFCNLTNNLCGVSYNLTTDVCNINVSECDAIEYCSGSSLTCPSDANLSDGTNCSAGVCFDGVCTSGGGPVCGNGHIEGEGCDDNNTVNGDGCDENCSVEDDWVCSGEPSVCEQNIPVCNNSIIEEGEECDDGNNDNSDGCDPTCLIEPGWVCSGEPSVCEIISSEYECLELTDPNSVNVLSENADCVKVMAENVTLDCDGFTISNNGSFDGVYSRNNNYTVIKNCEIINAYHGINLQSSKNNELVNVIVKSSEKGVYLHYVNDSYLKGVNASNNFEGIDLLYSNNNYLEDMNSQDNDRWGIYLHTSSNNELVGVEANKNKDNGVFLHRGSENNSIKKVVASNNEKKGVYLYHSNNNSLTNVRSNENNQEGMYLRNSSNNILTNMDLSHNQGYGCILVSHSDDNLISDVISLDNGISWSGYYTFEGLRVMYSDRNVISDVNFEGVRFAYSEGNVLDGARINRIGLYISNSKGNFVNNTRVINAGKNSTTLFVSDNNTITNFTSFNNQSYQQETGIYFFRSKGNFLEGAELRGAVKGVYLKESDENTLKDVELRGNLNGTLIFDSDNNNLISVNSTNNNDTGLFVNLSVGNSIVSSRFCNNKVLDVYCGVGQSDFSENTCEGGCASDSCSYSCSGFGSLNPWGRIVEWLKNLLF